tara:strand:- start:799 stop:1566 length:768 start_codon:yes stop_codon:yes gene_type:complete
MKALLLAGGTGTRLQPLTKFIPKCLAPVRGRPLLDYWIAALVESGISEILINTHYLSHLVEFYVKNSSWKNNVTLINEPTLLGTGGTISENKFFFDNEDFLVAHADNVFNFDFKALIQSHKNKEPTAIATMLLFNTDEPSLCGVVKIDDRMLIQEFDEKNKSLQGRFLANAAIYIFNNEIFSTLETLKNPIDISLDIIPKILGRINGCIHPKEIIDIGNLSSWNQANFHPDFLATDFLEKNKKSWHELLKSIPAS